jgi:4'-phosphopantetheinyl transferase
MSGWAPARTVTSLVPGHVHLWRAFIDDETGVPPGLLDSLCTAERSRADRFRSPVDGRRWAMSRGWLRSLLGYYLDVPPDQVELIGSRTDKPSALPVGSTSVQFSASRSGGVALYGFSVDSDVGVDVEEHPRDLDLVAIAGLAIGLEAAEAVASAPASEQAAVFATRWSRHEAAVKCTGEGLTRDRNEGHTALQTADVQIGAGFAAAVTTTGELTRTSLYTCDSNVPIRSAR